MVPPLLKQLYAALGSSCTMFANGYTLGLLSSMLPSLRKPESPIQISLEQESWLPAILVLVMFPVQFTCGLLTRRFGRKIIVIISLVPVFLGQLLFYFATDYTMLFAASVCCGLVAGGIAISHMQLAEIASPKHRGILLNAKNGLAMIGVFISHALGNYFDWQSLSLYGAVIPFIGIMSTLTIPESPAWLASKGRFKECRSSFLWYRGLNEEEELVSLIEKQKKTLASHQIEKQKQKPLWVRFRVFVSDKGFLKAIGISLTCVVLIEATGKQIFCVFAIDCIGKIIGTDQNPFIYAMILDLADAVAVTASCFTLHYFRRRKVLFGTGIPAIIILLAFCSFVYLISLGIIPDNYSWLALVILGVYNLFVGAGIFPLAFIVMGEIFPLSHRGEGVAVNSFVFVSLLFAVAKLGQSMLIKFAIHGTFLLHAAVMAACLLYLYIFLPETDKKTLLSIEDEINSKPAGEEMQEFLNKEILQNSYKYKNDSSYSAEEVNLNEKGN